MKMNRLLGFVSVDREELKKWYKWSMADDERLVQQPFQLIYLRMMMSTVSVTVTVDAAAAAVGELEEEGEEVEDDDDVTVVAKIEDDLMRPF